MLVRGAIGRKIRGKKKERKKNMEMVREMAKWLKAI